MKQKTTITIHGRVDVVPRCSTALTSWRLPQSRLQCYCPQWTITFTSSNICRVNRRRMIGWVGYQNAQDKWNMNVQQST